MKIEELIAWVQAHRVISGQMKETLIAAFGELRAARSDLARIHEELTGRYISDEKSWATLDDVRDVVIVAMARGSHYDG